MKNRILLVLLTMVMVVSLVAFAACKAEEAPPIVEEEEEEAPPIVEEEEEEVWQWPDKIAIIGAPGVGVASTTGYSSEMQKDTGMKVTIVPEINTVLRFKWLQTGRFFSCSEAATIIKDVIEAKRGYPCRDGGPFQLRILWSYNEADAGFIVRGDSDIKTIYDIKPGTRIADLTPVPGLWSWIQGLLAWVGVDEDDIVKVPASTYDAMMRFISDGRTDVSFCMVGAPSTMEAGAAPHGIRFLALNPEEDPEGAKRFLEFQPTVAFGVMSAIPQCKGVWGIHGTNPIMTRAEEDPELVYHYAKWLDENYDLYKDNHAWNKFMTIDNVMVILETWFLPAHDGLIKYLKEKGLWTAANDARQAQNVEFVTTWVKAYQEAINLADDQGIAVDPENEEWIELWENYKKDLPECKMYLGLEE